MDWNTKKKNVANLSNEPFENAFQLTLIMSVHNSSSATLLPRHILGPKLNGSDPYEWISFDFTNHRSGRNDSGSVKYDGFRPVI